MGLQNIEKTTILYRILYRLTQFYFHLFYRRFIILGRENIPRNAQLIFASNHQNALMDALALLYGYGKPVVFLARADIFKKKTIARILYFLKILPVFRPRDGAETMNQNYETFARTSRVLKSGLPIAILPEGTHSPIKKLQTLKKGICRIAFQTAESESFTSDIQIVPAGIDYTSYTRAGTSLLLIYGRPVSVSEFYPLYRENPQRAIGLLRDKLAEAIRSLMIHVENEEYFDVYSNLLRINNTLHGNVQKSRQGRIRQFEYDRTFIKNLNEAALKNADLLPRLQELSKPYFDLIGKYGIRDRFFGKNRPCLLNWFLKILLSVVLLPVHLAGMVFNYIPYKLPSFLSGKVKDKQFVSSVNYAASFVTYLLWYLLAFFLIAGLSGNWLIALTAVAAGGLSGLFAFYHYLHLKGLAGEFRFIRLRSDAGRYGELAGLRDAILSILKKEKVIG
ncbi:MAG TPA: 1-acyl-sn-glycerol-3-phosphate acyltransferase [Lentimicrobium sp.]|nr:1-acyl-sn-glycerol-3-phosphate acyltransferase [Lentimicrobium sp.]